MAPPSFSDIGKQSRDVFGKGYNFGVMKLEVKAKSSSGVEYTCSGNSPMESGAVSGTLETKYKCSDYGITMTEKWSTDNSLNTTIDVTDKVMPGLKLTLDGNFKPATGGLAGKFKTEYKHERLLCTTDMGLTASPVINMSASVGHGPWALGYSTAFDTGKAAVVKNNLALGYSAGDMVCHVTANDAKMFGGGIYHKVRPGLETGVSVNTSAAGNTDFGIGCKYDLGSDASIRAKVDNSSKVGLSYQQVLRPGITMTASVLMDATKLNQPGHKFGMSLEMSA